MLTKDEARKIDGDLRDRYTIAERNEAIHVLYHHHGCTSSACGHCAAACASPDGHRAAACAHFTPSLPGFAAHAQAGVEAIREASKPRRDYGHDVAAFNADHNRIGGCQMARTAGGDTTECDTHHAYVSHGVPIILRDAV